MQRNKRKFDGFPWTNLPKSAAVSVLLAGCLAASSPAQQPGQKTFSSAQEASSALVRAAQSNDEKALLEILGPDASQIVSSGDKTEDAQSRANFVKRYEQMHRLVREPDGTTTLYVGAENWPMPIPLMKKGTLWYFDAEVAKAEILYRRIGRNEISTIHVCQQLVAAEKEYYAMHKDEYAPKILSDEGHQDGLYWKAASGKPESPIGPLVAAAATNGNATPIPYRGYYYHVLAGQGASAPGGARSYIVTGKMTGGFAFVAYPAEYKSSGVMTFIVGEDGVVYRKDLGENTSGLAKAINEYNPDSSWRKDEDQQEAAAEQKSR
jgi:hypothetical protein